MTTLPTVHLNGTSVEDLFATTARATAAIRAAIRATSDAAPNARDYYPQGPTAYTLARAEHDARTQRLVSVLTEMEGILDHLADERDRRAS